MYKSLYIQYYFSIFANGFPLTDKGNGGACWLKRRLKKPEVSLPSFFPSAILCPVGE